MTEVDVLILGAGAAGLMCAIEAGRRGRHALVLEHADRPGKKILISGGGRCNFTNIHAKPENFLSANPHFAKSALARFTPQDFIALVEKHRIPYHEKTLGPIAAPSLVVATGGLSIPKMGATSFGYDLATQFGHAIVETRPGLVPLVFNPEDQSDWCDLAGISTEVIASAPTTASSGRASAKPRTVRSTFREKMLITHRGLSGPAILQISSYWHPGEPIELDLDPDSTPPSADPASLRIFAPLTHPDARRDLAATAQALRSIVPGRFADRWRALHARANPAHAQSRALPNTALAEIERQLHAWRILPAGTEGYDKAEVTVGGVDTNSLDAKTMQSRTVPGLYFIGEVVDVTGWLGGYNFQR